MRKTWNAVSSERNTDVDEIAASPRGQVRSQLSDSPACQSRKTVASAVCVFLPNRAEDCYTVEYEGRIHIVERVPARVSEETGEQYFTPETVGRINALHST